ncbi:MAG TPA: aldo/keto reductase [Granulicella sp.]
MQQIALGETGRQTTRLGFGCSSIMGALGRRDSLAMLEAAFDAGVRHFDVAPMYGYGEAEVCLGEFLERHRGQITVTTKYGIPPEPKQGMRSLARSMARPVLKLLPGMKKRLAGVAAKAATAGREATPKCSFRPDEALASFERSLRALRSERIDVWLLHEARAEDLQDDGLLELMERLRQQGKLGDYGVGSGYGKIPALLAERPAYCRVVQHEWSVQDAEIPRQGSYRIHHRSLTENFRRLHHALTTQPALCTEWSQETGRDLADAKELAALMLKAALVMNPDSVILFSSKNPTHIAENVRVAGDAALEAPARSLYALMQTEGAAMLQGGSPA